MSDPIFDPSDPRERAAALGIVTAVFVHAQLSSSNLTVIGRTDQETFEKARSLAQMVVAAAELDAAKP